MTRPLPWVETAHTVRLHFMEECRDVLNTDNSAQDDYDYARIQPRSVFDEIMNNPLSSSSASSSSPAYISVELPKQYELFGSSKVRLPSLVVAVEPEQTSQDDLDEPSVLLSSSCKRFFDQRQFLTVASEVQIRPHIPLVLSHIVLSAQNESAFEFAQANQDIMESNLRDKLVRQNDWLVIDRQSFQVVMSEPVLQGLVGESTEFFVTLGNTSDPTKNGHNIGGQNGEANGDDQDPDASNVIVDEHFLGRGALENLDSAPDDMDGSFFAESSGQTLQAVALYDKSTVRDELSSWASRAWRESSDIDVESCVLVDEAAFPLLGAVEGDWGLIEMKGIGKARAVKVLCAPLSFSNHHQELAVYMSPLLMQNLANGVPIDGRTSSLKVILRNLGVRSDTVMADQPDILQDCPLTLPFADAITISRVAGPWSTNRKYQNLFLSALKTYFEESHRIMHQGDVFAVSFDKSKAKWITEEAEESTANDSHDIILPSPWDDGDQAANAVVYFCVTDISPELPDPKEVSERNGSDWLQELAKTGQFGCVVDTSLTKMVQAGVTKSRVMDADCWLDVTSDTPPLPLHQTPLTSKKSIYSHLLQLVQATLLPHAADYGLHLSVLLKGSRGCGKRTVTRWIAQQTGVHLVELNCFDLIGDTDTKTEGILRARCEQARSCAPAILLLRHVDALARKSQSLETGQEPAMASVLQDCLASLQDTVSGENGVNPIAVVGTTGDAERCPTGVLACFRHELTFEAPNEAERKAILDAILSGTQLSVDVSVASLATQTAALVAADLVDLVGRAQLAAVERISSERGSEDNRDIDIIEAGVALTGADFDIALTKTRQSYSDNIGAPKIPNVTWDDVGGLASVKDDILDTIQLPLEHPELFSDGLKKRSGILLYGPPGTGKTLLAKAVATSFSLNFFSVKGPELLNMYIGESEANVRRVFQRARDAKPCVIFFDELDSIAPKRGNQGDSGGVMDRIVSQLLAELDGMSSGGSSADVFVIGATNRPDLLDPALLRPGRFDRMLYLAVSQTHAEQLNILQALTRRFKLDPDVGDLSVVAEQCPMNLTGADFYALCSDAMLKSMTRKAEWIDEQVQRLNAEAQSPEKKHVARTFPLPLTAQYYLDEMATPADMDVRVGRQDFESALHELVPSVSAQEMEHYRSVQARFSSTDSDETHAKENKQVHGNNEELMSSHGHLADGTSIGELLEAMRRTQVNGTQPDGSTVPISSSNAAATPLINDQSNGGTKMADKSILEQPSSKKGKGKARE